MVVFLMNCVSHNVFQFRKETTQICDSNNYRGISLSSIVLKIIDLIILSRYSDLLCTSGLQIVFKSKMSTGIYT